MPCCLQQDDTTSIQEVNKESFTCDPLGPGGPRLPCRPCGPYRKRAGQWQVTISITSLSCIKNPEIHFGSFQERGGFHWKMTESENFQYTSFNQTPVKQMCLGPRWNFCPNQERERDHISSPQFTQSGYSPQIWETQVKSWICIGGMDLSLCIFGTNFERLLFCPKVKYEKYLKSHQVWVRGKLFPA